MFYNFPDPLNESRSWSGTEMAEQKSQETAIFAKPHPPPRDTSAEAAGSRRRQAKIRSGERQHRTPADAHLKPLTDQHKPPHTVSAPAPHYKPTSEPPSPTRQPGPQSGGTQRAHKLAPLNIRGEVPAVQASYEPQQHRGRRGLQPLDSREPPHSKYIILLLLRAFVLPLLSLCFQSVCAWSFCMLPYSWIKRPYILLP